MTVTCAKRKEETMSHLIAKNIMINMVAELIAEKYKLSLKEARVELYRSEIISLLDDDETGLYGESPLYVFSLYEYYKAKPVFIWDLDGTLIDSYDIIVDSLCRIYKEKIGIVVSSEFINPAFMGELRPYSRNGFRLFISISFFIEKTAIIKSMINISKKIRLILDMDSIPLFRVK